MADHVAPAAPQQPMAPMSAASMVDVMQMRDDAAFGMVQVDQLEHAIDGSGAAAWELEGWYGQDVDKLWLRSEGERESGNLDARTELFWDHAFAGFWDWQFGARHDSGLGRTRDWAAFGVQGLAPYWIQIEATAYLGEQGRTAARLRAEYELLLTQRLVLQPEFELNLYGRSDVQRDFGSGLSDAEFGLRLRYEIRREFAPYIGVVWAHRFGDAADYARAAGRDAADAQLVVGLRMWF
ncbi:MAG: copper resistance protein B [Rudaea sp.]|nr:copper resistance protein B [Rudaea sp.]